LALSLVSVSFIGKSSVSFCRVAEIGFKVFNSGFGQRKFRLALFRGFGFVRGWFV